MVSSNWCMILHLVSTNDENHRQDFVMRADAESRVGLSAVNMHYFSNSQISCWKCYNFGSHCPNVWHGIYVLFSIRPTISPLRIAGCFCVLASKPDDTGKSQFQILPVSRCFINWWVFSTTGPPPLTRLFCPSFWPERESVTEPRLLHSHNKCSAQVTGTAVYQDPLEEEVRRTQGTKTFQSNPSTGFWS